MLYVRHDSSYAWNGTRGDGQREKSGLHRVKGGAVRGHALSGDRPPIVHGVLRLVDGLPGAIEQDDEEYRDRARE